jgi:hypothetical protein
VVAQQEQKLSLLHLDGLLIDGLVDHWYCVVEIICERFTNPRLWLGEHLFVVRLRSVADVISFSTL